MSDYRRQLFGVDDGGIPENTILEMIDLVGEHVVPFLRRELAASPT